MGKKKRQFKRVDIDVQISKDTSRLLNTSSVTTDKADSAVVKQIEVSGGCSKRNDAVSEESVDVSTNSFSSKGDQGTIELDCQVSENTFEEPSRFVTNKIQDLSVSSCARDSSQKLDVNFESHGGNDNDIECHVKVEPTIDNSTNSRIESSTINSQNVWKDKERRNRNPRNDSKKDFRGNESNHPQQMNRKTSNFERNNKVENQDKSKPRHNTHFKQEQPTVTNNSKSNLQEESSPPKENLQEKSWDSPKRDLQEDTWDSSTNEICINSSNVGEWRSDYSGEQYKENFSSNPGELNVDAHEYVPSFDVENNQPGNMKRPLKTTGDPYFDNDFKQNNSKSRTKQGRPEENWRNKDGRKSLPVTSDRQNIPKRYSDGNSRDGPSRAISKDFRNTNSYDRRSGSTDKEFKAFCDEERRISKPDFVRVKEIQQDLFAMPKEYSLGHCVAEDMRMGSGIAVSFKREFKDLGILLDQRQKQGGLAVLEVEGDGCSRYIYYLVTKRESSGKPTYEKFWSSVQKMRNHIRENDVRKLAIPRLGCGLDRLEWDRVKHMLEFLFRDVEVEITVCNFQQSEDSPEKPFLNRSCKVVRDPKPVVEIEEYTTILYLASEDGHVSPEMEQLSNKFPFLAEFKRERKRLGDVVRYQVPKKYYLLYGCVVRRRHGDPLDFASLNKCLAQINRNNKKDLYEYVAIQAVRDERDDLLMEKVITVLRNVLVKVEVYVCGDGRFPGEVVDQ